MILLPVAALVVDGFSGGLDNLSSALAYPGAVSAIKLTLVSAVIVAAINAVFGTLIAWVLVRYSLPGKGFLSTLVDLPFAIPTLVTGVMLVTLYGPISPIGKALAHAGIKVIFTPIGITLALLFVTLPFVVRTVMPVLLELDVAEEEAATVLGASRVTTFTRVVLPHLRPAIAAGTLLAFARCLGEFGAVVVVAGNISGKTLTAPVYIFQLTSQFRFPEAAAVSAVLFFFSLVIVMVTNRLVLGWGVKA
jgi:sulfate transport system permease protein